MTGVEKQKTVSVLMSLRKQCQCALPWAQSCGFSSLPQPIKRHEALKNDVESKGVNKC